MILLQRVFKSYHSKQESALALAVRIITRKNKISQRQVLYDISLKVSRNETLGIIGLNGSGKSTLLKIIAGISPPSSGKVETIGNIVYLNGFGQGLQDRLTMRENIYFVGALMELNHSSINGLLDEIVTFSELQDFLDEKVSTFSSGMKSRLSFSLSIHCSTFKRPDILLLDEVIGTGGDIDFNLKATKKMHEFIINGSTVVIVSHNLDFIKKFCTKVLWIKEGRIHQAGDPEEILREYSKRDKYPLT